MIIIEGKRENVAKELKSRFEYDGPFIERMLGIDPTGHKYVDYIAKQLTKIIPELAGPQGGLNVSQQDAISTTLSSVIPWFESNQSKITEDDIWKAETLFRSQVDYVDNISNIAKNPKDINQYTNPDFIRTLMSVVDSRKTEKQIEREAKTQVDKIYEDDQVLVVKPKSFIASCYYGANTKWCTTTKGSSSYFEKYLREGQLYYFIHKMNGIKRALFVKTKPKGYEVYTSTDQETTLEDLESLFPEQKDLIEQLIGIEHFVKKLNDYGRGRIDARELMDSEELIVRIQEDKLRGLSEIIFEFKDDSDFFDIVDLNDDDRWFVNMIFSQYSDYEFYDSYSAEDDWSNGYGPIFEFNKENKKKLEDISNVVLGNYKFDMNNDEFVQKLSAELLELFPDEIESIIYEYRDAMNGEMSETAKNKVRKDFEDVIEPSGFDVVYPYYRFKSTVGNLLMWVYKLRLFKVDLKTIFAKAIQTSSTYGLGGWYENTYEFRDAANFNSEGFNNWVERKLDNIIEKLEDEENPMGEFLEFRKKILDKFSLNVWFDLPKDRNIKFKIENIIREGNLIKVRIKKSMVGERVFKLTEEQFNNLLYQPQLFDLFGDD